MFRGAIWKAVSYRRIDVPVFSHRPLACLRRSKQYSTDQAWDEPRLSLTFTCTAVGCDGHRSSHTFTKRAYEHGVVLVECPACHNRHLIADHLGWFTDATGNGKHKTLEEIMRARGVEVTRGSITEGTKDDMGQGGVIEFNDDSNEANRNQGS